MTVLNAMAQGVTTQLRPAKTDATPLVCWPGTPDAVDLSFCFGFGPFRLPPAPNSDFSHCKPRRAHQRSVERPDMSSITSSIAGWGLGLLLGSPLPQEASHVPA